MYAHIGVVYTWTGIFGKQAPHFRLIIYMYACQYLRLVFIYIDIYIYMYIYIHFYREKISSLKVIEFILKLRVLEKINKNIFIF